MEHLVSMLRAAGDSTRLRLLLLLLEAELTVSELTEILGQSQPRVSRHLKLLSDAGLINRFQEGTWVFYRLADSGAGAELARSIVARISDEDESLMRDFQRLDTVRARLDHELLLAFLLDTPLPAIDRRHRRQHVHAEMRWDGW